MIVVMFVSINRDYESGRWVEMLRIEMTYYMYISRSIGK